MQQNVTQPFSVPDAARLIMERAAELAAKPEAGGPVIIGISGIDCSGKTTLADAVMSRAQATGMPAARVSADDFIIPCDERKHSGPVHIDYFENTFDYEGIARRVRSLAADDGLHLVAAEGVFLFRRELADLWHLRVWLEMPGEESVRRGAVRDAAYFGSSETARSEYLRRFVPAHEWHVERDRPVTAATLVFQVS